MEKRYDPYEYIAYRMSEEGILKHAYILRNLSFDIHTKHKIL